MLIEEWFEEWFACTVRYTQVSTYYVGDSETYITIEMIEMTALKIWSPLFLPGLAWLDLN